ncbi:ATP-binding protein [Nocardioides terrisoli]|uniref:ATP-binding protein n=1 Tax=Nocardioides terrisoli TaxID=3388267 RepID=UPI00287B643D|nr:ATP-binding protein [Nocardioides marmorisolisilvae]
MKRRDPRAATGRSLRRLRVPAHRATTRNLQAIYPFIVDSALGTRGVYIGRQAGSDGSFVFDPWELYGEGVITNPNILLAGVIGRGKSALAKTLALRMSAFGVRVYVPGDPKGEWGQVATALGADPIVLGRGLPARVNPLDPGPRPPRLSAEEWAREVLARRNSLLASLAETALDRRLRPVERNALLVALTEVTGTRHEAQPDSYAGGQGAPVLPEIVTALMSPSREAAATLQMSVRELVVDSRDLALELRRLVVGDLAGLFDGPTTHPLDFDAPIQVLDTSRLAGDDTAVALLMTCASAWMEATLASAPGGRRLVVYDEAWRMLRHLALVRRMQAQWKLSRALGVANLAVVHRISDLGAVGASGSEAVALAQGLLADCSTRIVYAQESDQVEATATTLGLTDVEADQLVHLPRGRALWKIGRHSAIVDHLLGEEEVTLVDTDGRMRGIAS